jgi:hypothetical protein
MTQDLGLGFCSLLSTRSVILLVERGRRGDEREKDDDHVDWVDVDNANTRHQISRLFVLK